MDVCILAALIESIGRAGLLIIRRRRVRIYIVQTDMKISRMKMSSVLAFQIGTL